MVFSRSLIAVCLLLACVGWAKPPDVPSRVCKELSRTYFRQSQAELMNSLASLDLEKQYVIYLCGSQYKHPPILSLVKPFASQGQPVVDMLRSKVGTSRSDLTVRDILRVFVEMKRQKIFDARNDADLMRLLDERVQEMKSEEWREIARGMCSELAQ
jgi:hypothetical protein